MTPLPRDGSPLETAAEDIALLSAALSSFRGLGNRDKIKIARRIGFGIGLGLLSKGHFREPSIQSGISSLFTRLQLRPPILGNWGPVVFVTHSVHSVVPPAIEEEDHEIRQLEAAFGEGVVEGLISGRGQGPTFLRHSITIPHSNHLKGEHATNESGSVKS